MNTERIYFKCLRRMFFIEVVGNLLYSKMALKENDPELKRIYTQLADNEQKTSLQIDKEIKPHAPSLNDYHPFVVGLLSFLFQIVPNRLLNKILQNILKKRMYSQWSELYNEFNPELWTALLEHENLQHELLSPYWNLSKKGEPMDREKSFQLSFRVLGAYDVLLGFVFALFYRNIYESLNMVLPNHPGYIFAPALFIVSAGIGEFLIAQNPLKNFDLVIVRLLMKSSFTGVIVYCYFRYGVPIIFLIISVFSIIGIIQNVLFLNWAKSVHPNK